MPAGVPGLSGTYPTTYGYDRADHVTSVGYPTVGGLPEETVETRYDTLGLAEHMAGLDEYVNTAVYDDRARPLAVGYGAAGGPNALAQWASYDQHQRLAGEFWTTGPFTALHGSRISSSPTTSSATSPHEIP